MRSKRQLPRQGQPTASFARDCCHVYPAERNLLSLQTARRNASLVRHLLLLAMILSAANVRAQTPSPLQEWQYSGGIILARLFEPDLPQWRTVLGLAAELQPAYSGARAYRLMGG